MTKIILVGCLGRMGKVVRAIIDRDPDTEIVAGVDVENEGEGFTFPLFPEVSLCDMPAHVVVDFSGIGATDSLLEYCMAKKIPLVTCTTGFSPETMASIKAASERVAVFQSANMSLGINLINHMLDRASKLLYDAHFDVEIIEKHHNQKLDAPSGTALMLADTVKKSLGEMQYIHDRSQSRDKRQRNEIGLHALRGGTIVGEHTVVFAGQDEIIELTHKVASRNVFAVGAVKAARFMKDKPPGLYTMQDLIEGAFK
jgi:4-hydroxy-tetrahydrodipicolinate reductase